jgi:hypothetical protein
MYRFEVSVSTVLFTAYQILGSFSRTARFCPVFDRPYCRQVASMTDAQSHRIPFRRRLVKNRLPSLRATD